MKSWPVQDAKARFSELLDICVKEGPQLITKRGAETAVLAPISEWRRLAGRPRPSLKELLLTDWARGELNIPERGAAEGRSPPDFD